jgi:hypothetical protein
MYNNAGNRLKTAYFSLNKSRILWGIQQGT